jgi:cell division septation protein DedD
LLIVTMLALAANARAEGLDAKGDATAKEATSLYKQGSYEEAAKLFAQLSVDYPDMTIFERNAGACFYYLHRPEPALSNLRNYLNHTPNIEPDDKAVVDRWIAEMEKLQAEKAAASAQPAAPPPAPVPVPVPTPAPEMAAPSPAAPSATPGALDVAAKPEPAPQPQSEASPFYKTWWFWTGVGVVVAGAATTVILLSGRSSAGVCDGASVPCQGVK